MLEENVYNKEGNISLFSFNYFKNEIIGNRSCFICGNSNSEKEFNNEHIVPNWILKKLHLHDDFITLLNRQKIKYSQYKIPCCKDCNTRLSLFFEGPLRTFFELTFYEKIDLLTEDRSFYKKVYCWLALIFCKQHIYDNSIRYELDKRKENFNIGDIYDWGHLYNIHNIARSFFSDLKIDDSSLGSFIYLPSFEYKDSFNFDLRDNYYSSTQLLRLGDITFITSFCDGKWGYRLLKESMLDKISGPIKAIQAIEIFCFLTAISYNSLSTPHFLYKEIFDRYELSCDIPLLLELKTESERLSYSEYMKEYALELISECENKDEIIDGLNKSTWSFIFDSDFNFIQ